VATLAMTSNNDSNATLWHSVMLQAAKHNGNNEHHQQEATVAGAALVTKAKSAYGTEAEDDSDSGWSTQRSLVIVNTRQWT